MNVVISFMIVFPLVFGAVTGRLDETVSAFFDGANSAVLLVMSFAGVMCLWTGILRVAEDSGAGKLFEMLLRPVIRFLFPNLTPNSSAVRYITLNITANLLGLANGATPMGVRAMQELDRDNPTEATDEMCMFTVLNTAAFSFIPTSVLSIRAAAGGQINVLVPIWITSIIALSVAVMAVKITSRLRRIIC